jgi:hypothetical protein
LPILAAVVVLIGGYAWWTARRLDRLHVRLDAAAAGLDDQLGRRAAAALGLVEFGPIGSGDDADRRQLGAAVSAALALMGRIDQPREAVENDLGDAIASIVADADLRDPEAVPATVVELLEQATRATFARRFYNDAVRDVLVVRDRRVVRWLHLSGRAPRPSYVELDEGLLPPVPYVTAAPSRTVAEGAEP